MVQKANLTPLDKYEPDRRQAERLDPASLIDTLPASDPRAIQPAPTADHQHREGPSFWQAIKTMFK
jgi:hypothetical protein